MRVAFVPAAGCLRWSSLLLYRDRRAEHRDDEGQSQRERNLDCNHISHIGAHILTHFVVYPVDIHATYNSRMNRPWVGGVIATIVFSAALVWAIELNDQTRLAFDEYARRAEQQFASAPFAFVERLAPTLRSGTIVGRPGSGNGILEVQGGLIHHWHGAAFHPGATADMAQELAQRYEEYPKVYDSVVSSQLLGDTGDVFRVRLRIKERAGVVTSVVEITSTVTYVRVDTCSGYSVSRATEIREILDAGESAERALPAGTGHGYLWRATTFSSYRQQSDGLYVYLETLGLSRGFPAMLGWIIEPIARRLGRKSVEGALAEFRLALKAEPVTDRPSPPCT